MEMNDETDAIIARVVERIPLYLRNNLASKDAGVRKEAEEALAAMISSALANGTAETSED
ncbi:hypothetical protein [Sphingobium sp. TB-6]|uniref:hypothetical protein n=2 Tax=unclassified Sphingobium TaxID=2611147 RepID=UPI00146EFEF8|nr:hypothetical protein [Sphingobium sp. TB-6]